MDGSAFYSSGTLIRSALRLTLFLLPPAAMTAMILAFPSSLAEDAYIILRYSRNIAQGYGFVWNPGEGPVWGSTSILWTLILSVCGAAGADLVVSAQVLNVALGLFSVTLISWYSTTHLRVSEFNAFVGAMLYSLSTVVGHVLIGFDVMLYSFLLLVTYILTRSSASSLAVMPSRAVLLVSVCFLLGVTRPEGLVVGSLSVLIAAFLGPSETLTKRAKWLLIPYSCMLILFLLAVLSYFGTVLPNPLLIKASGSYPNQESVTRSLSYVSTSISLVSILCVVAWILSLQSHDSFRQIVLMLPPVAGFVSDTLIAQSQNVLLRFQFPITPLLLMLMPAGLGVVASNLSVGASIVKSIRSRQLHEIGRSLLWLVMALLLFYAQYGITRAYVPYNEGTDKMEAGRFLSRYNQDGYTIVVSEAGMIPYYCEWRVIDAWGLNDPLIAESGLTDEYLSNNHPEVVQFHEYFGNITGEWQESDDSWNTMTWTLANYCIHNDYALAAITRYQSSVGGKPIIESYQWYFVLNGFADSAEIVQGLSSLPNVLYHYRHE